VGTYRVRYDVVSGQQEAPRPGAGP